MGELSLPDNVAAAMRTFAHAAGVSGLVLHQPAAGRTDTDVVWIAVMLAARAATAAAAPLTLSGYLRHPHLHLQKNFSFDFHNLHLCAL